MIENRRVLIVAPHPDDESLGAGGAAAKFAAQGCEVSVLVVSGHLPPLYTREQYEHTVCEATRAFELLGIAHHRFVEVPATMVAAQPVHELNGHIAAAVAEMRPQVLLLPYPDRHVDHRAIFDSVMVARAQKSQNRKKLRN